MWDMLIGHFSPENEEFREKLMVAAQTGQVTDALLAQAQPIVESHLRCTVILRVIPFGRDASEAGDAVQFCNVLPRIRHPVH